MLRRFFTTKADFVTTRRKFDALELLYEAVLDLGRLTGDELAVHMAHLNATRRYHFTYDDPKSGEKIYTRYYHFLEGKCCGQACRHCTFNLEAVPKKLRKQKVFNSSFWRDGPDAEDELMVVEKLKGLIRVRPSCPQPDLRHSEGRQNVQLNVFHGKMD